MRTVFRTAEAIDAFGRPRLRSELRAGRWQRPARGVVVTHNAALSRTELQEVALCLCSAGSALGGLTALERHGLTGFATEATHVVLPEGSKVPAFDGLVAHSSRELSVRDVRPDMWPPTTRSPRSVVDAASWTDSDRRARAIVLAAFQQGRVSERNVRDALSRRGPCHRRALIKESLLDAGGGIHSLPERDFDAIRITRRLPRPTRQRAVKGPHGRYFLDAGWDALAAFVEIHGIHHKSVHHWDDDLARGNEIVIGGRAGLYFSSYAVRREPERVGDQLERFLRACGWDGSREV